MPPVVASAQQGFNRVEVGVIHRAGEYPLWGQIFYQTFSSFTVKKLVFNVRPKLCDSHRVTTASVDSVRAGINPAPTQWVGEPFVGAGFTPARRSYHSIQIAQFR